MASRVRSLLVVSVVLVFVGVTPVRADDEDSDDDYYESVPKFIWNGNGANQFDKDVDACRVGEKDIAGGTYKFKTVEAGADADTKICVFTTPDKDTDKREIRRLHVCKDGVEANFPRKGKLMCRCKGDECKAKKDPATATAAPPPDNSQRCTQVTKPTAATIANAKKLADASYTDADNKGWTKRYDDMKAKVQAEQYKKMKEKYGANLKTNGFPEFDPSDLCPGANDVRIGALCGSDAGDFAAANNVAGYAEKPKDCTWHHHEDLGRFQLVKTSWHEKFPHTGGRAIWMKTFGMKTYP